jgi:hypothetical protein
MNRDKLLKYMDFMINVAENTEIVTFGEPSQSYSTIYL